jgi:hypothetical protein
MIQQTDKHKTYRFSSLGTHNSSDVRRACKVCEESFGSTFQEQNKNNTVSKNKAQHIHNNRECILNNKSQPRQSKHASTRVEKRKKIHT